MFQSRSVHKNDILLNFHFNTNQPYNKVKALIRDRELSICKLKNVQHIPVCSNIPWNGFYVLWNVRVDVPEK